MLARRARDDAKAGGKAGKAGKNTALSCPTADACPRVLAKAGAGEGACRDVEMESLAERVVVKVAVSRPSDTKTETERAERGLQAAQSKQAKAGSTTQRPAP